MRGVHGDPPSDDAAPIVPDQAGLPVSCGIKQPEHVGGQGLEPIRRDGLRLLAPVAAPLVRGPDSVAGGPQRRELMPPPVPELRKAIQQEHQRARSRADLGDVQANAVRWNLMMVDGAVHRLHQQPYITCDDTSLAGGTKLKNARACSMRSGKARMNKVKPIPSLKLAPMPLEMNGHNFPAKANRGHGYALLLPLYDGLVLFA